VVRGGENKTHRTLTRARPRFRNKPRTKGRGKKGDFKEKELTVETLSWSITSRKRGHGPKESGKSKKGFIGEIKGVHRGRVKLGGCKPLKAEKPGYWA